MPLQESVSPLLRSETSIETTSTQNSDVDDDFENNPYFFEELDSYTYQTTVGPSSDTTDSDESTAIYTFDVSIFLAMVFFCYQCYAICQLQNQPLLDPLIEMLEAWSFGDSEITTTNTENSKNDSAKEFKFTFIKKDEELTKNSKEPEDITPELTAQPVFVGDKTFIPSSDNLYQDAENFSLTLEHYLTTVPRANLPHHCMGLDLTDEPVREPMPNRPLGVCESKQYRYQDKKFTVGQTHMSSISFKQWMELKEERIKIEEVSINEAERKLMRDKRLGYYRCRPSNLRRCWTVREDIWTFGM